MVVHSVATKADLSVERSVDAKADLKVVESVAHLAENSVD